MPLQLIIFKIIPYRNIIIFLPFDIELYINGEFMPNRTILKSDIESVKEDNFKSNSRRKLLSILEDIDSKLSDIYRFTLDILDSHSNPFRVNIAAYCLRTIIYNLPVAMNIEIEALKKRKTDELDRMIAVFKKNMPKSKRKNNDSWNGEIDKPLVNILQGMERYLNWSNDNPTNRSVEIKKILKEIDPSNLKLPDKIENLYTRIYQDIWNSFNDIAHNINNNDFDKFEEYHVAFVDFMIKKCGTSSIATKNKIDQFLKEGE